MDVNNLPLKPYDFKVEKLDNDNLIVRKIYAKFPAFIVYRTDSSIRLELNDDMDIKEYTDNHLRIGVDLARIYSLLPEKLSWSEPINKQIARAISTNVMGNFEDAQKMLHHAEERIIKLKTIQGRIQYTLSALSMVLCIFLLIYILPVEARLLAEVMLCGALGGLLSITVGYNSLEIDIDANRLTNSLIGSSRIIIAIIASLFSYFAIQTGIAFSFVKTLDTNHGIFLFAMISGFAEMLVPNMMNNLAKENTGKTIKTETHH
ncbi:hypothetical protein [Photobacterium leiognathi]|uniref:hypothetical protein n=1 Tax=Photobacterium leiognathi TaxID=553611 RepID=UPI0027336A9C|nr:hypothetical protein [Photobacterium leiognathi]